MKNSIVNPVPTKAPRASSKPADGKAGRRLAAEKQKITDEIARLTATLPPLESEFDRLQKKVQANVSDAELDRADLDETLAVALNKAGEALAPIYAAIEEQKSKLQELDQRMPDVAEETLRAMYPAALQTRVEIERLGEIEARLQLEKTAIERDCDPSDEAKLKELEGISIRLSVIPGKTERWQEKLAAQIAELAPFWESARHALSRGVAAQLQIHRDRLQASVAPFFMDGKLPAICEHDLASLFRETPASEALNGIEMAGNAGRRSSEFSLDGVPPLLAAFDALENFQISK